MCGSWTIPWMPFSWRWWKLAELGTTVQRIRSKNAGPFWLTIDLFCGSEQAFDRVVSGLNNRQVAALFHMEETDLKRFDIAELNVVKFSLPRPRVQGSVCDTDMHGAAWANLLASLSLP